MPYEFSDPRRIEDRLTDFDQMRDRLVGLGAGERALVGTVVRDDVVAGCRAAYSVTEDPPTLTQVLFTKGIPSSVTHITIDPQTLAPAVSSGKAELASFDTIEDDFVVINALPLARLGRRAASATFIGVHNNVRAFEPDS